MKKELFFTFRHFVSPLLVTVEEANQLLGVFADEVVVILHTLKLLEQLLFRVEGLLFKREDFVFVRTFLGIAKRVAHFKEFVPEGVLALTEVFGEKFFCTHFCLPCCVTGGMI